MPDDYKYWAFISYSHQDKAWGDWLHKALETYRVPARLVGRDSRDGKVPKRLFPIFRDREELPTSSDLGSNINEALKASRYLVVICSPKSAVSRWVNEEVKAFKAMGREDRILCLIVDGEPNASDQPNSGLLECFPEAVRYRVDAQGRLTQERTEPIAADAREGKDGKADARLKTLAGLLGVAFDELKQREKQRQLWRRVQLATATGLILVAIGGVWHWQAQRFETRILAEQIAEIGRKQLLNRDEVVAAINLSKAYELGNQSPSTRLLLAKALESIQGVTVAVRGTGLGHAAATADGRVVATEMADGRIRIWRESGGAEIAGTGTPVHGITLSDNGSVLALAAGGIISIWNAVTGEILHQANHYSESSEVSWAISGDGTILVTRLPGNIMRAWDVVQARQLWSRSGNLFPIVFDGSGKHVLVVKPEDNSAELWDVRTGRAVRSFGSRTLKGDLWFLVSGGRKVAASDPQGGRVHVWDAGTGKYWKSIDFGVNPQGTSADVSSVAWSFDLDKTESRAAVGTDDGTVVFVNLKDNKVIRVTHPHKNPVRHLSFSADGDRALSLNWGAGVKGAVRVWDTKSGAFLAEILGGERGPLMAAWTDNDRQIVSVDWAGTVQRRDATRAYIRPGVISGPNYKGALLNGDGTHAALQLKEGGVEIWRLAGPQKVGVWNGASGHMLEWAPRADCIAFVESVEDTASLVLRTVSDGAIRIRIEVAGPVAISPDCEWVAYHDKSGPYLMRVQDEAKFPVKFPVAGQPAAKNSNAGARALFAFSLDGRLAIACRDDHCVLSELGRNIHSRTLALGGLVTAVDLSPDGSRFAVAIERDAGVTAIYRVSDGAQLHQAITGTRLALRFSKDATQLLAMGGTGEIVVLQVRNGEEWLDSVELEGPEASMFAKPVFTHGGAFVVAGTSGVRQGVDGLWRRSTDHHLWIWDAHRGKLLWSMPYADGVSQIASSGSGDSLFVVSYDNSVYMQEHRVEQRVPSEVRTGLHADLRRAAR